MSFTFSGTFFGQFLRLLDTRNCPKAGHLPLGLLIGVLQNSAEHKNFETDKLYQSNSSREAHRILIQELEHFGGGHREWICRGIYRPRYSRDEEFVFLARNHLVSIAPLSFIMSSRISRKASPDSMMRFVKSRPVTYS